MNVIRASMFITPIAGAVGGASAVKTHSSSSVIHEQSFRFHLKTEGENDDQYSHRD
jgi:hypothetical protein